MQSHVTDFHSVELVFFSFEKQSKILYSEFFTANFVQRDMKNL